ncbi:MAG TPA: hypothetical protein VFU31_20525, partial [Candidatus Binatia bacterium]|nr:hypothetical protein [Candidatus Binatia bacterium]
MLVCALAFSLLHSAFVSASTKLPLPPGIPATNSDTEKYLLRQISEYAGEERAEALWRLAGFYLQETARRDLAIELLNLIIEQSVSRERTAVCCAALGQMAEDIENWELAIAHYRTGLAIGPSDVTTVYFL